MIKKLTAFCLALLLLVSFASCASNGGDEETVAQTQWDGRPSVIKQNVKIENRQDIIAKDEMKYFLAVCTIDGKQKNVIASENHLGEINIINSAEGRSITCKKEFFAEESASLFYEIETENGVGTEIWYYHTASKQSLRVYSGVTSNILRFADGELSKNIYFASEGKINVFDTRTMSLDTRFSHEMEQFMQSEIKLFSNSDRGVSYRTCVIRNPSGCTFDIVTQDYEKNGEMQETVYRYNCLTGEVWDKK